MAEMIIANPMAHFQQGFSNALAAGAQMQRMQAHRQEMERQNQLSQIYQQYGSGILEGKPEALNALISAGDVGTALQIRQAQTQNALATERMGMERDRFGMATEQHSADMEMSELRMTQLREQGRREAEAHVARMSAADREREAAETEAALRSAAVAYKQGPEAFETWKQQNAPMFEQFDMNPAAI